jgi:hypothetical protein
VGALPQASPHFQPEEHLQDEQMGAEVRTADCTSHIAILDGPLDVASGIAIAQHKDSEQTPSNRNIRKALVWGFQLHEDSCDMQDAVVLDPW